MNILYKKKHVSENTLTLFKQLVIVTNAYTYTLHPAFIAAITDTEQRVKAWREEPAAAAARRRQRAAPPGAP